jgi:hypothetical protein
VFPLGVGLIGRFHSCALRGIIRRGLVDAEYAAPFPDFGLALEAHRLVEAIYRSYSAAGEAVALA